MWGSPAILYQLIFITHKSIMLGAINVVGARPNFIKMAPIIEAMQKYPDRFQPLLVHTGQHYDERMSKSFSSILACRSPTSILRLVQALIQSRPPGSWSSSRESA